MLNDCAKDNATVFDLLQALDYRIGDLLRTIVIGNFVKLSSKMDEVWHPVMHYQYGFCFTFNPAVHSTADLDLNSREDLLRFGSLNFNVSTFSDFVAPTKRSILTLSVEHFGRVWNQHLCARSH